MDDHRPLTIGLFGFGVVGEGLYKVLQETSSVHTRIKKICIRDQGKIRNAPAELFTTNRAELLNDAEINVIVEVINQSGPAFEIVSAALRKGKSVVSASKKMIAEHFPELMILQKITGHTFLYEAAACASIPVIRNLEEYYDNDGLHSMRAIVNGTTNFILSPMLEEKLSFDKALQFALERGFAETDPSLDIAGGDAAHKWSFLLAHAYGVVERFDRLVFNGITEIKLQDALFAKERGYGLKLVAQAQKLGTGKVAAFILPQFILADDPLAFVKDEFNGVVIENHFADRQFFYGKGAGSLPTASALLSDISATRCGYKYGYKKLASHLQCELDDDFYLRVYMSFDDWETIPVEKFEKIDQRGSARQRNFLVGILHFRELQEMTGGKKMRIR